jgi:hypothetical protein
MSHLPLPHRREAPGARRRPSRRDATPTLLSKPSDQLLSVVRVSDQPPPDVPLVAPPNFLTRSFSGEPGARRACGTVAAAKITGRLVRAARRRVLRIALSSQPLRPQTSPATKSPQLAGDAGDANEPSDQRLRASLSRSRCRGPEPTPYSQSAAAGVVAARRARVARPRALHHAAALTAGRTEIQTLQPSGHDRRGIRERRCRRARAAVSAVAA